MGNELKLYQITNGFMQLADEMENGELTEEEEKEFQEALQNELAKKSANIIAYALNKTSLIDAIDEQIKRLQNYKKTEENKLKRYKEYVKENMQVLNITKIETPVGKIQVAQSPISVEIINENEVPEQFKIQVITTKIDKKAITDNFKETGEIPDGVKIYTENTNLRIK